MEPVDQPPRLRIDPDRAPPFSASIDRPTSRLTNTGHQYDANGNVTRTDRRWVMTDRLDSVRANGAGERFHYYPYGGEIQPSANGRTKFATYYRDPSGLDYADQRYYASTMGRFLTPDPSGMAAANPKQPHTWNRYSYAGGDPVNSYDPSGLYPCFLWYDCGPIMPEPEPLCGPQVMVNQFGYMPDPGPFPCVEPEPEPPQPPTIVTREPDECNSVLWADIANYLGAYRAAKSSLYTWANMDALVSAGMIYDVDPRFIVGLAVAETQAGTNMHWGPYNAWNLVTAKPPNPSYTSWDQAITAVTMLAASYMTDGYTNTESFYKRYEHTSTYRKGLGNVNKALTQMGGKRDNLTDPCSPLNPRRPN